MDQEEPSGDEPSQDDWARVESVIWGRIPGSAEGRPANVPWEQFAEAMRAGPEIFFTRPVRADTVHPGSVFLTALLWERQADYLLTRRIPASLKPLDTDQGYAKRFRLQINPGWIGNEIDTRSELKSGGRVELTIRGQMIRDRADNMLDALPPGYEMRTPPHGRPGGDFVALLRFAAETREPPAPDPEPEPEPEPEASI